MESDEEELERLEWLRHQLEFAITSLFLDPTLIISRLFSILFVDIFFNILISTRYEFFFDIIGI